MTYEETVAAARARITELTPGQVEARLAEASPLLVDVREPHEFDAGSLDGAIHLRRNGLASAIADHVTGRDAEIILICSVGERSAVAAASLLDAGYSDVASMAGGLRQWRTEGRAWSGTELLGATERDRYSRHLLLGEVGEHGQARLLESRVLLIGAGGLSSPAALYLAAAGVGTIGVVDFDSVEASNLQRQILHTTDRIGDPKVESAAEALGAINPDVRVEPIQTRLSAAHALDIMGGFDVVIDGTDNFPTRYLVNDASLHLRIPVVHGSVFRFEGQATVFQPFIGPCYRCLFAEPPPPELAPSCAEAGVLGVLPGVIGSIQATEAIKLLLGIGDSLVGRLLTYDALSQEFMTLTFQRDPDCPACGEESQLPALVDYDPSCRPGPRH